MGRSLAVSLLPAAALFVTFYLLPLLVLGVTSFAEWSGPVFQIVGLDNFRTLLADPTFWKAVRNTLFFIAMGVFVQVPLGCAVGVVLAQRIPGWRAFRTILFLPYVISGAAFALVFTMFYNQRYGLLNSVLRRVGVDAETDWLFSTSTARWAVAAAFVFIVGFAVVLVIAEVGAIPRELYEAAEVDGANALQRQLYVTAPLLRNVIGTLTLLSVLGNLGSFDLVYILTAGGPADSTVTMVLYGYRAYTAGQWGLANAVGVIVVLVGLILIVAIRRLFRIGEPA